MARPTARTAERGGGHGRTARRRTQRVSVVVGGGGGSGNGRQCRDRRGGGGGGGGTGVVGGGGSARNMPQWPVAGQRGCMRRGEGEGGGPEICAPKTSQINISRCKFHFFPRLTLGLGGGGGAGIRPPPPPPTTLRPSLYPKGIPIPQPRVQPHFQPPVTAPQPLHIPCDRSATALGLPRCPPPPLSKPLGGGRGGGKRRRGGRGGLLLRLSAGLCHPRLPLSPHARPDVTEAVGMTEAYVGASSAPTGGRACAVRDRLRRFPRTRPRGTGGPARPPRPPGGR